MKIVKAEVFVTCPGRNFVTLKITTEDGITGLGDATLKMAGTVPILVRVNVKARVCKSENAGAFAL